MTWKMCYRRLIETCPCVDINSVRNVVDRLGRVGSQRMCCFVVTSRRKQQAAIWCECQPSEEGCHGLVVIYCRVPHS